jgi:hypothetical protein
MYLEHGTLPSQVLSEIAEGYLDTSFILVVGLRLLMKHMPNHPRFKDLFDRIAKEQQSGMRQASVKPSERDQLRMLAGQYADEIEKILDIVGEGNASADAC